MRLLIGRLNKIRKKQAQQIDILCNDFIAAQKQFVNAIKVIGFSADFYEGIAGVTDLNELLGNASVLIQEQIPDINVAFFLLASNRTDVLQPEGFELHIFESNRTNTISPIEAESQEPISPEDKRIENFFTTELVDEIGKSNRLCTMDDMLGMGLAGNPSCIEKIAAVGLPLNNRGCSLGFVLLYRSSKSPITGDELKSLGQISAGLVRSIAACRATADMAN
jgi:hypothetical protein